MSPVSTSIPSLQSPVFDPTVARDGDIGPCARPLSRRLLAPAKWACRTSLDLLARSWLRIESEGLEHLPTSGPFLIAANHCSHLDALVVCSAVRKRCHVRFAGAKDYFFRGPVSRFFAGQMLDILPIDRRQGIGGLRQCLRVLMSGEKNSAVLFFPEGTRSATGVMQPFRAGLGLLAIESGVPVVPAWINGTFDLMPRGRRVPKRGRVRVVFGPPLRSADVPFTGRPRSHDHFQMVVKRVQECVADLIK